MRIINYAAEQVHSIRPTDSIDRAISLMEEHDVHHLVVVEGAQVVGMLSDRDVLISTGWMLRCERQTVDASTSAVVVVGPTKVRQIMSRPAVCIRPSDELISGARLMLERRISALPVLDDGKLVGLVTETGLLNWFDQLAVRDTLADVILHREVRDLMRHALATVTPGSPLDDVVDIFRRRRVRHVPVVVEGRLVGIISDRDVRRALGWSSVRDQQAELCGHSETADETLRTAADIMTTEVVSVRPSTSLRVALRKMIEGRIHAVPVTEGDCLCGILTQTDFTKVICREVAM